jgi:cell wall-associated NlpC family hydrolase
MSFNILQQKYSLIGHATLPGKVPQTEELLIKIAKKYMHSPFMEGGRSPFGIDGAGLVQLVYKQLGIHIGRKATQQAQNGELIGFIDHAQIGDIAFFKNTQDQIIHCGIILDDRQILHSYGKVRIDLLDHHGIYHKELKKYTHKLRVIKRILPLKVLD